MNFIIIVKGVDRIEYEAIREDFINQNIDRGVRQEDIPLFIWLPITQLPAEPEIEIVWISEEIERANFKEILGQNYDTHETPKILCMMPCTNGWTYFDVAYGDKQRRVIRYESGSWGGDHARSLSEKEQQDLEKCYRKMLGFSGE